MERLKRMPERNRRGNGSQRPALELPAAPFASWSRSSIASWLADHDGMGTRAADVIGELCERLLEEGLPIWRVSCALLDSHPQISARAMTWRRDAGTEEIDYYGDDRDSEGYDVSPVKVIHDGAAAIRRRLEEGGDPIDFPLLEELKSEGGTDYLAMALPFADGSRQFISWASDAKGGFSAEDLERLVDLMPLIGLRLEIDHARHTGRTLLNTYLGPEAATRIAGGTIRRFECEMMQAIILYCDMRGFTQIVDTLPPDQSVRVLSLYYEAVAEPIRDFGGDIVKMIGDGVLAIFPLNIGANKARVDHVACGAAAAVRKAQKALEAIPCEALPEGVSQIRAGFALHAGEVFFGNVGSNDRLDFTVIGPAVNEAVRVEALTKELDVRILTTQAFADLDCPVPLRSLGSHVLRGVREPKELFTLV